MHTLSVNSVLHSSHLVKDDCAFSTVNHEGESGQDDSTEDETTTDLSESIEKSLYHIYLGILS